ncbi:MAG TPA: hypothetical protein VGN11_10065 [Candidatus Baltobacteraceae bacterium]|nr:hypothetical protein [Candidatus Baltobacteraceae bacterium]
MSAPILRLLGATFASGGDVVVPPIVLDVYPGSRYAHLCTSPRHAHALAMLAAGLARPSRGDVLIGEYDPRVQPVHCKHLAAFVPHDPLVLTNTSFGRYIDYRAALWDIDAGRARAHATLLLDQLGALHEAFAYLIVAALLPSPRLLILDRPQLAYAQAILAVAGQIAIFSTHTDAESAAAYAPVRAREHA